MASITNVPTELLEYILINLDSRDAVNLVQTCKALHAVALPAAYHTITLWWDDTPKATNVKGTTPAEKDPEYSLWSTN